MSIISAHKPAIDSSWIRLAAWVQVTLGSAGLVAVLASPLVGVVVGVVVALAGAAVRALAGASRTMDSIFDDELG